MRSLSRSIETHEAVLLSGARYAIGPLDSLRGSIEIQAGRIVRIHDDRANISSTSSRTAEIDLSGFLVMPGLINAHDHLQFALYPNLGTPPYRNYIEWGDDIHARFPDVIAEHKSVPRSVRLWWGGIRNLLCGVTTVCHHDPLWPALQRDDFAIKVVQRYGWAHSAALGGDLQRARLDTPDRSAFIVHACEGVDELSRQEVFALDRLGILDANTVLVHGLALDEAGTALLNQRQASLIVCPSSNQFLFERNPDMVLLATIDKVGLGNDSPLTAKGDLLDELRFVIDSCGITSERAYTMVTETASTILQLRDGEGALRLSGTADLIAIRDTGEEAAERLNNLSIADIELVFVGGQIKLASEKLWELLPAHLKLDLECLQIGSIVRWLRAPVKDLLRKAEEALGAGQVRLGGRFLKAPDSFARVSTVHSNELLLRCGGD